MNDGLLPCQCVVDTDGLHEIAMETSGNLKPTLLDQLKTGIIRVPSCVWAEFAELYPQDAARLVDFIPVKITLKKQAYIAKAAVIAEKLNSGFSRGLYDNNTDLYAASIASVEGYSVLTAAAQVGTYATMGCKVIDLGDWLLEG